MNFKLIWFWWLLANISIGLCCASCMAPVPVSHLRKFSIHAPSKYFIYSLNNKWHIHGLDESKGETTLRMLTTDSDKKLLICTELDTLHIDFKVGDSLSLSAVVSDKDTVQILIVGIRGNVQFNPAYQKQHNNKIDIHLPEISELANIALAITDVGLNDSNMINHKGSYYQEVLHQFLPFKKAPFIVYLDSLMQSHNKDQQYWIYYTTEMNACTYK